MFSYILVYDKFSSHVVSCINHMNNAPLETSQKSIRLFWEVSVHYTGYFHCRVGDYDIKQPMK